MAQSREEERSLISAFNNQQKKYGTASASAKKADRFVPYEVMPGDTLQGIALKHNVTMEQLKRANRLWTNDSLALRPTLLIPVFDAAASSPLSACCSSCCSVCTCDSGTASSTSTDSLPSSASCWNQQRNLQPPTSAPSGGDLSRQSAAEFLSGIDSAIAASRRSVSQLSAGKAADSHDEDVLFSRLPRGLASSRDRRSVAPSRGNSEHYSEDPAALPLAVIRDGRPAARLNQHDCYQL